MFLRLFEETEDDYISRHKTGNINTSAYASLEEPGGCGKGRGGKHVDECPKVLGTLAIKAVDGLAGNRDGRNYRELFDLILKVKKEISNMTEDDLSIVSSGYPEHFRDVHFKYNNRWLTIRNKTEYELSDHNNLKQIILQHIIYEVYGEKTPIPCGLLHREKRTGESAITFRQTGEKLKYISNTGKYLTDEEILAAGYPMHDSTVYAFDGPNCIGYASDEFGAVGVFVERNYQRQGIGRELLKYHLAQFKKERIIGQMTTAGEQLVRSYFRTHRPQETSVSSSFL